MKKKIVRGLVVIALTLFVGLAVEGIKPLANTTNAAPTIKTMKLLVDPPGG